MSGYLDPAAVATLCDGAKQVGRDSWVASCPAHDDKQPSLSIDKGRKGTLLYCHRGCTITEMCLALEIQRARLFADYDERTQHTRSLSPTLRRLERRRRPPTMAELKPHQSLEDVIREVLTDVSPERWAEVGVRWPEWLEMPFPDAMEKDWVVCGAVCGDLLADWIDGGYDYSLDEQHRLRDKLWMEWDTNGDTG